MKRRQFLLSAALLGSGLRPTWAEAPASQWRSATALPVRTQEIYPAVQCRRFQESSFCYFADCCFLARIVWLRPAAASFNPRPEAMAGVTCEQRVPLSAIASGFGLNREWRHYRTTAAKVHTPIHFQYPNNTQNHNTAKLRSRTMNPWTRKSFMVNNCSPVSGSFAMA